MELKLSDGTVIDLNGQLEILGWGTETTATPSDPIQKLIADPIVEKEVREELKKPEGEPPFSIFGSGIFFIIPC